MATMSIRAMYDYNPNLFDFLQLPQPMVKQVLVQNIINNYAELEVLYPDPDFMEQAIAQWAASRLRTWTDMVKVMYEDYDPFINIKRDEVRTIVQDRDLNSEGTSTLSVSAWNSDDFENRNQQQTGATDSGRVTTTEHFHVEGDSAITDAQDVLRKEMEVRTAYNMYDIVMNEFKKRFLLQIY